MPARALAAFLALATPGHAYRATIIRVTDGDTLQVHVPAWKATPFADIGLRIAGIDTPEDRIPPAKCAAEVAKGKVATAFARTVLVPGQKVVFYVIGRDKYFRLDARVSAAGRDFGTLMLSQGYARPYAGGMKSDWCN